MIKVGEIVDGKYRVARLLGEGGMGIVVEAYHDTLDMLVAIKFMRSDMVAASGGAERFLREARALVKLKSQHAVKVHDLGVHRRMPYIVMEHLEGMDMQTALDKHGPMLAADVARHIRQACEAIAEAHSLGIYHRDLKPANLFLAQGASGRIVVKVLDFGIAKIMRPAETKASLQSSLTGTNTLMGTIPYMSPEQLLSAKDIDARADIWSLGVVLHELVTGDLPFQGRDMHEIQQAIRFEACIMPALPASLEPIIRRCLEKNREDRYQSAVELAIALRPLVNESLSPFASAPIRIELRTPQGVIIRTATASPLPISSTNVQLAAAEGLPVPKDTDAPTIRAPRHSPANDIATKASTPAALDSDDMATPRITGHVAPTGTLIMAQETPEPPTVKRAPSERPAGNALPTLQSQPPPVAGTQPPVVTPRMPALAHLKPQVVTVRRNVLVVKQPIQLARRRQASSRSRLLIGVVAMSALVFGFQSYCSSNTAVATCSSMPLDAVDSGASSTLETPSK